MTLPGSEFKRLILEHLDGLYNLARWMTKHPDNAQDLVQETVLKVPEGPGAIPGGNKFYRVAV